MPTAAVLRRTAARPSAVAAFGLVGGFAAARSTGRRDVGGMVFAAAGAWCAAQWSRTSGTGVAAGLTAGYVAAMGLSHPLARKFGAWRSVLAVTAATVAGSEATTALASRHR